MPPGPKGRVHIGMTEAVPCHKACNFHFRGEFLRILFSPEGIMTRENRGP